MQWTICLEFQADENVYPLGRQHFFQRRGRPSHQQDQRSVTCSCLTRYIPSRTVSNLSISRPRVGRYSLDFPPAFTQHTSSLNLITIDEIICLSAPHLRPNLEIMQSQRHTKREGKEDDTNRVKARVPRACLSFLLLPAGL
jgi:hypothetical protein